MKNVHIIYNEIYEKCCTFFPLQYKIYISSNNVYVNMSIVKHVYIKCITCATQAPAIMPNHIVTRFND